MTGSRSSGSGSALSAAVTWLPLGVVPAVLYLGHFFLGAVLDIPALTLLAVLSGLLCVALAHPRARADLTALTPVWPLVLLFGLVIGAALLSLTPWAPGGAHPIWVWVDGGQAASLNRSATLIEVVKLIGLAAVFVLGCLMGADAGRARRSLQAILWLGGAYALIGLVLFLAGDQTAYGSDRLAAGFFTPNVAGTQFGVLAVLATSWAIRQWRRHDRAPVTRRISEVAPAVALILLFLVCLLMTASRGAMGATALGIVLVMGWEAIDNRRARLSLIAGGCLLVVVAFVMLVRGNGLFLDRFSDVTAAGDLRGVVNQAHWRAFLASPLSGYGLGSYPELNNMIMTAPNAEALSLSVVLHNVYLQWLVEGGVVGAAPMFLLIAVLIGITVWRAIRRPRNRGLLVGLLACSLLVLVHGAVDVSLNTPSFVAFWTLLLGLGFALSQASGSRR